jgi:TolA-binding protein
MITDANGQFQFAEQYFRAGEFFRAVGEYERFVYFFPDDPRKEAATHKIGLSYFKGKKFEQAISAFKAFLAQFPSSELATETRFRICDSLVRMGSLLKAVKCLTGIAEAALDTDIADRAYYLRGWIYLELDEWEDAAESFELISKKNRKRYRLEDLSREMSWKGDIKPKARPLQAYSQSFPGQVICTAGDTGMQPWPLS